MKQALFIIGALFCCIVCAARPKIIDLSWSNPTIDFLQKNLSAMENSSPLNGITIRVRGESILRKGKKYFAGESLWTASKVEFKHFAKDITALKKLPFKKFTDNFYYSTTYYYDLDWYDDAAWARAAANFGVAARVCREAGLKGILLDIEEYGKRFWNYDTTSRKEDFKTTCKIVYRRGQQWGKEVFSNYPEIVLFMPFMFSLSARNLTPFFINGILSVMPPAARIMEGCEADSYRACKPEDYPQLTFKHYCSVRTKVAPENRNKYLTQTELAPGFYIDAYVRLNHFAKEKKQCGSAVGLLRRNLAGALKEAGTYIWFYGEYGCWWKNSLHAKARKTWEEQAPGITEAVKELMAPEIVFKSTNLLKNPLFKDKSAWTPWQREMDQKKEVPGTITTGNGQTVLKKVTGGCVSQLLPVIPGEYYLFQFRGADLSSGAANATIAFRDQKRKWLDPRYTCSIPVPDTGKFETVTRLIVVPQGASWISIQLGANSLRKQDSGEVIYTGAQLLKY